MADEQLVSFEFPCDPEDLPTSSELPVGDVILEIKSIKPEFTKPNTDGTIDTKTGRPKVGEKLAIAVQFALAEPEDMAGIPHTQRFYIGSNEDPKAEKVGTWKRNATLLMSMFKAAHVGGKTKDEYFAAALGQKVGASVKVEKSRDPKYQDKNVPRVFWEPGTRPVRVLDGGGDAVAAFGAPSASGSLKYDRQD